MSEGTHLSVMAFLACAKMLSMVPRRSPPLPTLLLPLLLAAEGTVGRADVLAAPPKLPPKPPNPPEPKPPTPGSAVVLVVPPNAPIPPKPPPPPPPPKALPKEEEAVVAVAGAPKGKVVADVVPKGEAAGAAPKGPLPNEVVAPNPPPNPPPPKPPPPKPPPPKPPPMPPPKPPPPPLRLVSPPCWPKASKPTWDHTTGA